MAPKPKEPLDSLGGLSTAAFHILVSLAESPKHGYAMMEDIGALTGSRPGPGTLYAAIARLEEKRWIEPVPSDDRKRPYRLTSAGRQILRAKLAALQSVTRVGQSRLADV
jgi:DNA-binding PadR family transcriptional regulator